MDKPVDPGVIAGKQPETPEERFVKSLEGLVERKDLGALAALRRGLGRSPGDWAQMHPYVVPWLPRKERSWQEDPYYHIAALFAWWYQGRSSVVHNGRIPASLGASFARLADATDSPSVERRFVALLNCHPDDLPDHLRHAVGLMRTDDIPVNWVKLLNDIQGWGWESRSVQRDWARAFWGRGPRDTNQESTAAVASSES